VSYYRDSVVYHFDKYGFRSIHPLKDIDFSKPRILFIGDSVTFGYGLNYEDTYATKIGKLFKDKYEIINIPGKAVFAGTINLLALGNEKILSFQENKFGNERLKAIGLEVYDPPLSQFLLGGSRSSLPFF